ncbi:MAG: Lrp/AsnC ligand binding domain-containing protein, partial [bacterium]
LSFGGSLDTSLSMLVLRQAFKWGVTYWDTANTYMGGRSETGFGKYFIKFPTTLKFLSKIVRHFNSIYIKIRKVLNIRITKDIKTKGGIKMVTALVLLTVQRDKVNEVADKLSSMDGVSEVYSLAGRYDLAAIIRVSKNEGLSELVTNHMLKVEGIIKSETLIAFRVYSRHDLESMFSIGLEE